MYGSVAQTVSKVLITMQNEVLRIVSGALESLQMLTNEPSLETRREALIMKYHWRFNTPCYSL